MYLPKFLSYRELDENFYLAAMEFHRLIEGEQFHFKKIAHQTFLIQSREDSWIIYQKKIHQAYVWTCADESIPPDLLETLSNAIEEYLKTTSRKDQRER